MSGVCEAFVAIAELGAAEKIRLNELPGTWHRRVDDQWEIEVNGHQASLPSKDDFPIEPYHCVVKFNGWPAGILNPSGGCIAAGEAANEGAFIAALRKETARVSA